MIELNASEKEKPLTWFVVVNLALLFIGGCWMVGSIMVTARSGLSGSARPLMLTSTALANSSFPVSILTSILGTANILKEEQARRATAYAFAAGILLLIASTLMFCWILISKLLYQAFD